MSRGFCYLAPKIVPVFPGAWGTLLLGVSLQRTLANRALPGASSRVRATVTVYAEGKAEHQEQVETDIVDGRTAHPDTWLRLSASAPGYAEIAITAEDPIFWKIMPEVGYSLLETPDGRQLTVNADTKYANIRIVNQIKRTNVFCMLHSACLSCRDDGIGGSIYLINPYEQAIVARLRSSHGRELKQKVEARSAAIVDLAPIIDDGRIATVMVTGNNRIVTYDLKHAYGAPERVNSIDHLDPFSGLASHGNAGPIRWLKVLARRSVRRIGSRLS